MLLLNQPIEKEEILTMKNTFSDTLKGMTLRMC